MNRPAAMADDSQVTVSFSLACPGARSVYLARFFNDWASSRRPRFPWIGREPGGPPMVRELVRLSELTPAKWRCEVSLQSGWCEYLFLVDAEWVLDPEAAEKCPDGNGDFNSARKIEPVARRKQLPSPSVRAALRREGNAARQSAA